MNEIIDRILDLTTQAVYSKELEEIVLTHLLKTRSLVIERSYFEGATWWVATKEDNRVYKSFSKTECISWALNQDIL